MQKGWKYFLGILLIGTLVTWAAALSISAKRFRLIACEVGQGDAILAVWGSFEILTDGGPPNGRVVNCLSKYMPFWDRELEVVVNTHPQLDHYGGLIEVFKKYKVDYFVANALESGSQEYQVLKKEVGSNGSTVINPKKGTSIRYGMMHYDIFWPSSQFLNAQGWDFVEGSLGSFTSKTDPNAFSIQALVSFGDFKALLTGDIGQDMSSSVLPNFDEKSVNYIKIPHHGSRNGLTGGYLNKVTPEVAVISVGKNNRYGHPHNEILNLLKEKNIRVLRTDEDGDVVVVSDGTRFWSD